MKSKHQILDTKKTAYHEAGHAVLAHFLGVGLSVVSIVSDDDSLGHIKDGGEFNEISDDLRCIAEEAFWLRMATVRYAGAEAVRRLSPRSNWKSGAANDYHWAGLALEKITLDLQSRVSLRTYAERRARVLVEHYWPEIDVLARRLLRHKTLKGEDAIRVILKSAEKRRAGLMQY